MSMPAAKRAARCAKAEPTARYSAAIRTTPIPDMRRSPLLSFTVSVSLASRAGLRNLTQATSGPRVTRRSTATSAASRDRHARAPPVAVGVRKRWCPPPGSVTRPYRSRPPTLSPVPARPARQARRPPARRRARARGQGGHRGHGGGRRHRARRRPCPTLDCAHALIAEHLISGRDVNVFGSAGNVSVVRRCPPPYFLHRIAPPQYPALSRQEGRK